MHASLGCVRVNRILALHCRPAVLCPTSACLSQRMTCACLFLDVRSLQISQRGAYMSFRRSLAHAAVCAISLQRGRSLSANLLDIAKRSSCSLNSSSLEQRIMFWINPLLLAFFFRARGSCIYIVMGRREERENRPCSGLACRRVHTYIFSSASRVRKLSPRLIYPEQIDV